MKRNIVINILALLASMAGLALHSCIDNDLPYPSDKGFVVAFEVAGQTKSAVINTENRTVTVDVADTVDLRRVTVDSISLSENARALIEAGTVLDLTQPHVFTIETYATCEWVITATQDMGYTFHVEHQVGEAVIEPDSHRAIVFVSQDTDLSDITVTDYKFGPAGMTSVSPDPFSLKDFENRQDVKVTVRGQSVTWSLFVGHSESDVTITGVDAWTSVAWLRAAGRSGADNGFEYRKASSEEWLRVPADKITSEGGSFSTRLDGLSPETEYECRAYSGESCTETVRFTTDSRQELPNGNFESWSKSDKVWNPWGEGDASFWDTGNKGATTMGEKYNVTTSAEDPRPGSNGRLSARLQSAFPSAFGIGKFAAGNLFSGVYAGTSGTNGKIDFGREFTARPLGLKGWYKANVGVIDKADKDAPASIGDRDMGSIYIMLTDWSTPHRVDTSDKSTFIDPDRTEGIIAYGHLDISESVDVWTPFEIQLEYRRYDLRPKMILVVCSASKLGDYFTGSTASMLCIDDFELIY